MQQFCDWFHVADLMWEEFDHCFVSPNFSHVAKNHENGFHVNRYLVVLLRYCFVHPCLYKLHYRGNKSF